MAISTTGVGSGIDINGLVDKLVANEGSVKSQKFDTDEASALAKITGFGSLKGALSEFQTALGSLKNIQNFQPRKSISSDESIFTAVATNQAVPSSFTIEVTQLATHHKLTSADFNNSNSVVGVGTLTFHFGGTSFSINISNANQTLSGIRDKINASSADTGVQASIVNVDSGSRLVLTSTETGADHVFTVSVEGDVDGNNTDNAGLSQLVSSFLTTTQTAVDANVNVDGAQVSSSSNTVEGAIDGVTLDLLKTNVGLPENLNIIVDQSAATAAVQAFVDSYNKVFDTLNDLTKYGGGATSNVQFSSSNNSNGVLLGDSLVRTIQSKIRQEINTAVTTEGSFRTLADIGITSNSKTGKLELSYTKLTQAMTTNFDGIGKLFAESDQGIANRLDVMLQSMTKKDGLLEVRINGLNDQIGDINQQRVDLERYLQAFHDRMLRQFTAMDTLVAQLNSTSDFLTQQLKNLPEPLSFKK